MKQLLVVGLGNYPKQYNETRHNVGFMAIDNFANKQQIEINQSKFNGMYTKTRINDIVVYLAKPYTFMNLSGEFIKSFIDYFKIEIDDVIVLCDDVDTEFGQIKVKLSGSSGGQNGLKNIINMCGTQNFKRIRIGIGKPVPPVNMVDHVLSKFKINDLQKLDKIFNVINKLILDYIKNDDFNIIMSRYNQKIEHEK